MALKFLQASIAAAFIASVAAESAVAADPPQQPLECRGGILTDPATGAPALDRTRKSDEPIRCGPPPEEFDPVLVGVGALALVGAGVGGCAAARCFEKKYGPPIFPVVLPASR